MSRGTEFLNSVIEKLNIRIEEVGGKIQEVQKDIQGMHEYYWENYTEMDQYGYENFDNQQALLTQVNAEQENRKLRHRLQKMLDSPFFGSVDFLYEGDEEPELFYIGIGNFAEKAGGVPLIYDWRAPVCSLFYDYDKGPAFYEAPGGRMDGEIVSKWQYKIRDGKMVYEFESDVKIDDDILKQELGANGDVQLKNIVRTIQKEQNAIIRNMKDKILIIQGAAGSGKTSIALHRIAYLLYHDRKRLNSSNILILSPNSVFSDYISHVLPELGEEHIQEMSFDLFAYRELRDVVSDCEDRYHYMEHQMKCGKTPHGEWKQSDEFVHTVEGFLLELEDRLMDFRRIEYRGFSRTDKEIWELFYYKFSELPLLSRMDAVMEYFVDEYETLYQKDIPEEELENLREKFQKMYVTTDVYEIYNWLLEDLDMPTLHWVEKEQRYLEYEDVYPLLYLKYRLLTRHQRKSIRHLVIDEMQDYSYLQYVILQRMFSCNMTILGDRAQTVDETPRDVLKFLPKIFGKQVRKIEMNKSYRNTLEIAKYAEHIGNVTGITYLERHGKEVEENKFADFAGALDQVLEKLNLGGQNVRKEQSETDTFTDRKEQSKTDVSVKPNAQKEQAAGSEGFETAAVLTMTEQEAKECYSYLKKVWERKWDFREEAELAKDKSFKGPHISYIDRDSTVFRKGLTVTTFYQAKGLEFDQVFLVGGDQENAFFKQFRYIGATRALHELYVYDLEG